MSCPILSLLLLLPGCPGDDKSTPSETASTANTGPCAVSCWYVDADGDGYGDPETPTWPDEATPAMVSNGSDCDDTRGEVHPGAEEVCGDGLVNDCDDEDGEAAWALCPNPGPLETDIADATLIGEDRYDYAGGRVLGAGDVDGDARDDLLVTSSAGVHLLLGPFAGERSLADVDATFQPESEEGYFRGAFSGAGDVDGDGLGDYVFGATSLDLAYVVYGPVSGEVLMSSADARMEGDESTLFGNSVTGLGDVDGDGGSDLLIGAPLADGLDVESDLGYCSAEHAKYGPQHGVEAGADYLFLGPVTGTVGIADANARLIGEDGGDHVGLDGARPGDLDGDGLADLFVDAWGNCEEGMWGATYVVLSPVGGDLYLGDADAKLMGPSRSLSGAGDVNGDGTLDLLVADENGGPGFETHDEGEVHLVYGPFSGTQRVSRLETASFYGEDYDHAGSSIASAGDLDVDGFDDLIIGAPGDDTNGDWSGMAAIVYGPIFGSWQLDQVGVVFLGEDEGEHAGYSVAGVGDTDADGLPDVAIGAPYDDAGGDNAGAAYLLLGGSALAFDHGGI